ncbi:3369_t:CDS:2 [Gigaspora rosea]|nr:3369_t:CDS:2 [Gigaspora rosea]
MTDEVEAIAKRKSLSTKLTEPEETEETEEIVQLTDVRLTEKVKILLETLVGALVSDYCRTQLRSIL